MKKEILLRNSRLMTALFAGCITLGSYLNPTNSLAQKFKRYNTIIVHKFYDTNLNGIQDNDPNLPDEPNLEGWKMTLSGDATDVEYTDANGNATFTGLANGDYTVTEGTWSNWIPIPTSLTQIPPSEDVTFEGLTYQTTTVNFANVCIGGTGYGDVRVGSKRFYGSKKGLESITTEEFCSLNNIGGIGLRNADGTSYNPISGCPAPTNQQLDAARTSFDAWLEGANGSNIASKLYVQFAVMFLNYIRFRVSGDEFIYAPGTNSANALGFATLFWVLTEASELLSNDFDGLILAGDPKWAIATALTNALDSANNNKNFRKYGPCDVYFGQNGNGPAKVAAASSTSAAGVSLTTFPNPLTERTTVSYTLPEAANVSLIVYDGFGKQVAVLHNGEQAAGQYTEEWNAKDLAAGMYFCRLVIDATDGAQHLQTTKMLLIK